MSKRIALEINDTGIIVHDGQQVIENSPAYIVDAEKQSWIGKEALGKAFLCPNHCENKYWSKIAQSEKNTISQHDINLAMCHLSSIWQQVSNRVSIVILVVPATFNKVGLGVLLGICRQLHMPVSAMIHQAVLCPYHVDHPGDTLHVDVQLHRVAVTSLTANENQFVVEKTQSNDEVGLLSLYTHLAEFIAQEFINKTRLDPLHSAELEQQLHNSLPDWLQISQKNNSVSCQLQYQGVSFEVTVDSHHLHAAYVEMLEAVINSVKSISVTQHPVMCISRWFDAQFGLSRYALKHKILVRVLDLGHYAQQSFYYDEQILSHDGQVYLNKQLPYIASYESSSDVYEGRDLKEKPNAVMFCHHAYFINECIYFVRNKHGHYKCRKQIIRTDQLILTISGHPACVTIESDESHDVVVNHHSNINNTDLMLGDSIGIRDCRDELILVKVED